MALCAHLFQKTPVPRLSLQLRSTYIRLDAGLDGFEAASTASSNWISSSAFTNWLASLSVRTIAAGVFTGDFWPPEWSSMNAVTTTAMATASGATLFQI